MAVFTSQERRRYFDPTANPLLRFDWLLLFAVGATCGFGLTMVYSTTRIALPKSKGHIAPTYYLERQGIALVIGVAVAALAMVIDYRKLRDLWPLAYGLSLPLLLAVRFVGVGTGGTTAWFNVGPFQFQPSELAKLVLIVSLAGFCSHHEGEFDAWRLVQVLALAGIPMALVMLQNDLGTMLVMAVCAIAVMVVAGLKPVHLVVLFLVTLSLFGGLLASGKFATYRLQRLTSFLDQSQTKPVDKQTNAEFSLQRALAANSNGGLTGQGLYKGVLTNTPNGVPAQRTDFIFTAVGEQLGFAGGAVLLALFALMVWRTWRIAATADDRFAQLIGIGFVAMFTFQIFENIGMTMGMMPITGIPLPFMSYGGSAMIAYWAAIGLIANIHFRRT